MDRPDTRRALTRILLTRDPGAARIRKRTRSIGRRLFDASPHVREPNFTAIHPDDLTFLFAAYDARFMATARESRCCTVFITQNISNLYAAVSAQNVKYVVDSLLANFMTKIFCANADSLTNRWAADLIAQSWQLKTGSSSNMGQNASMGSNISQQLAYQVLPAEFNTLTKGGPPDWIVETILFQGGRTFATSGTTFERIAFSQR